MYKETYRELSHGTDEESAEKIKANGFEIRGRADSWCGHGVYFYDIKKKAWWAAKRKCEEIKKETGKKIKPTVLFADIIDIDDVEKVIMLRSLFISYYSDRNDKKLIIGNFRQRPQPMYEHAIEFSNSLDMIFGIETIYCVKDKNIIENIH